MYVSDAFAEKYKALKIQTNWKCNCDQIADASSEQQYTDNGSLSSHDESVTGYNSCQITSTLN